MSKRIDCIGKKYGRLTVLSEIKNLSDRPRLECLCDCGKKKIIRKYDILYGNVKSCGCFAKEIQKYKTNSGIDLMIGCRFGRLKIIDKALKNNKPAWKCICYCGKEKIVTTNNLINASTRSCGCYKSEYIKNRNKCKIHNIQYDKTKIGLEIGNIKILSYFKLSRWHGHIWKCECKCGNKLNISDNLLKNINELHCGCIKTNNLLYQEIKYLYDKAKKSALKRNLEFSISQQYIWNLLNKQKRRCKLTNVEIEVGNHSSDNITASIDRIDSNKGYVEDNVQWVHKKVNKIKQDLKESELIDWCRKIVNHVSNAGSTEISE